MDNSYNYKYPWKCILIVLRIYQILSVTQLYETVIIIHFIFLEASKPILKVAQ
jgi:hypothetical protein